MSSSRVDSLNCHSQPESTNYNIIPDKNALCPLLLQLGCSGGNDAGRSAFPSQRCPPRRPPNSLTEPLRTSNSDSPHVDEARQQIDRAPNQPRNHSYTHKTNPCTKLRKKKNEQKSTKIHDDVPSPICILSTQASSQLAKAAPISERKGKQKECGEHMGKKTRTRPTAAQQEAGELPHSGNWMQLRARRRGCLSWRCRRGCRNWRSRGLRVFSSGIAL